MDKIKREMEIRKEHSGSPYRRPGEVPHGWEGKTYKVVRGDSFYKIAKMVYGDHRAFEELQEANEDIGNILEEGQILRVPGHVCYNRFLGWYGDSKILVRLFKNKDRP